MLTHYHKTGSIEAYMSEVRSIRASKIYRQDDFDDTIEEEGKDIFIMASSSSLISRQIVLVCCAAM